MPLTQPVVPSSLLSAAGTTGTHHLCRRSTTRGGSLANSARIDTDDSSWAGVLAASAGDVRHVQEGGRGPGSAGKTFLLFYQNNKSASPKQRTNLFEAQTAAPPLLHPRYNTLPALAPACMPVVSFMHRVAAHCTAHPRKRVVVGRRYKLGTEPPETSRNYPGAALSLT
eukprot:3098418-Prymnesium_polylepis.1